MFGLSSIRLSHRLAQGEAYVCVCDSRHDHPLHVNMSDAKDTIIKRESSLLVQAETNIKKIT